MEWTPTGQIKRQDASESIRSRTDFSRCRASHLRKSSVLRGHLEHRVRHSFRIDAHDERGNRLPPLIC